MKPVLSSDSVGKIEETLKKLTLANDHDKPSFNRAQLNAHNIPIGSGATGRSSRRLYDRYSMPAGIPEEAAAFFKSLGQQEDHPTGSSALLDNPEVQPQSQRSSISGFLPTRPVSHHEGDSNSIFASNASFGNLGLSNNSSRVVGGRSSQRPRSFCGIDALGSSWSMNEPSNERPGSAMSEYGPLNVSNWGTSISSSASNFGERGRTIERPKSAADIDANGLGLFHWRLANPEQDSYDNEFKRGMRNSTNSSGLTINVPDGYPLSGVARAPGSAIGRPTYENDLRSPLYSDAGLQSPIQSPMFPPNHNSRPASRPTSPAPPGLFPTSWGPDGMKRYMPQGVHNKQFASMTGGFTEADYRNDIYGHTRLVNNQRNVLKKENKTQEVVDLELLNDIPAWLRSLRLHKYTPLFEGMKWQDIIQLSDEQLTQKGVAALGARRKMLKVFEAIKEETGL
ncbi:Flap-structured DNA-binding and RNA-binding protein [Basidiobolus ranarum]|uniref:RNA-binding protein VTS1 n=1 Tax=Basidiobolus ranarum TaxID=34480 RepID=A0ABR2WQJ5_9FUNG